MKQKNVILLIVAVGCGIVAAVLTSQMSAKGQVEQVDVLVAAKDLPVGTTITREDLDKGGIVKIKKMPKDGLPPSFVVDREQLVDKRLARPLRAEETFNPQDLVKGGAITLPPGHNMVSLPIGVGQSAAGFVGPGSRVDVLATLRLSKQLYSFPLLVNMLVVAVNTQTTYANAGDNNGAFPNLSMVSFAVKGKEALVLSLAKTRGCNLELVLRHPETSDANEGNDKLEDVIKLLSDEGNLEAKVIGGPSEGKVKDKTGAADPTVKPAFEPTVPPTVAPRFAMVDVLVAKEDLAPNTQITLDLIKEKFEWKEVPKDNALDSGALVQSNYEQALGQAIRNGISKNQWVTWTMVGLQKPKDSPREFFFDPKAGLPDAPLAPRAVARKNYHDVLVVTNAGATIWRYEILPSGQYKKVAELTPEQAAKDPDAPQQGAPDAKKVD